MHSLAYRIPKIILTLITVTGCAIQLQSIFVDYFKFKTVTRNEYVTPYIMEMLSLSICTPYSDIVDYNRLWKVKKIGVKNLIRDEINFMLQDSLSIREIFNLTPSSQSIVKFCSTRYKSTRILSGTYNHTKCNELFSVGKYFTQEFICYLIEPKVGLKVPFYSYMQSVDSPGEMYHIGIDSSIASRIKYLKLVVHSNESLPGVSKRFAFFSHVYRPTKTLYRVRFIRHYVRHLGYPYDPFLCIPAAANRVNCLEYCVNNKSIKAYGRIFPDLNTRNHYDYKHVSKRQAMDPEVSEYLDEIYSTCVTSCSNMDCNRDYTMTDYRAIEYDLMLKFVLETPVSPDILITFLPKINSMDLFVYVMSALGSWFGFAIIQLNPTIFLEKIKKYPRQKIVQNQLTANLSQEPYRWHFLLPFS